MTIHFRHTTEEVVAGHLALFSRNPAFWNTSLRAHRRSMVALIPLCILAGAALLFIGFLVPPARLWQGAAIFPFFGSLVVTCMLTRSFLSGWERKTRDQFAARTAIMLREAAARGETDYSQGPTQLEITDDGLSVTSPNSVTLHHWSAVEGAVASVGHVVIFLKPSTALAVPAGAFGGADGVRAFLDTLEDARRSGASVPVSTPA